MGAKDQNEMKPPVIFQTVEQLAETYGHDSVASLQEKWFGKSSSLRLPESGRTVKADSGALVGYTVNQAKPVFLDLTVGLEKRSVAEQERQLEKLITLGRTLMRSAGFENVESYRSWLLQQVEARSLLAITDDERQLTSKWKARIEAATDEEFGEESAR